MNVNMLLKKIKKNCRELFQGMKEFGIKNGFLRYFYYELFIRYGRLRDHYIALSYSFYEKFMNEQIERYKKLSGATEHNESKNIWVCWWQGYEQMPELCRMCYINLKKNIPKGYTLTLVTKNNFSDYVSLPEHVLRKVNEGILPVTQFSDVLRNALLSKIGGLWIDSSIWITPGYFNTVSWKDKFWSIKQDHVVKDYMIGQVISGCRWSSFNMYGMKGNLANSFVFEAMCEYYKKYDLSFDYFGQNFFFRVAYNNVPEITKLIDNIPCTNSHIYSLFPLLNYPFSKEKWDDICSDQGAFKLSQKAKYKDEVDGKITFHGYIKSLHEKNMNNENRDTDIS